MMLGSKGILTLTDVTNYSVANATPVILKLFIVCCCNTW